MDRGVDLIDLLADPLPRHYQSFRRQIMWPAAHAQCRSRRRILAPNGFSFKLDGATGSRARRTGSVSTMLPDRRALAGSYSR